MEIAELVAALSRPGVLPGSAEGVEVRQTHASVVFLTAEHAWKLKKPVDFGFLDYSTSRRRALMCRREVELNRRLAPGVYEGIARVTAAPEPHAVEVNGRGRKIDTLVQMRRLADHRSLESLLRRDKAGEAEVRAVAVRIGQFHRAADEAPTRLRSVAPFRRNARENFEQLAPAIGRVVRRSTLEGLERWTAGTLSAQREALARRVGEGRVREGHGDLRMEHVYFDPALEIIDCIEFNQRMRFQDIALDIAFLAMDMTTQGFPDLADVLLAEWSEAAGDRPPPEVLRLYLSYRALVRAKVAFFRSEQRELDDVSRAEAVAEAVAGIQQAKWLAGGRRRPRLLLVGGLSGTGKSWLAPKLARIAGARLFSADETRKRLAGLGSHEHPAAGLDEGLYAPGMTARVYEALIGRAEEELRKGRSVVLDATFRRAAHRIAAQEAAARLGAEFGMVLCQAPPEVVRRRLERRAAGQGDPWSDATVAVYEAQRERFEEPDAGERCVLRVDTTRPAVDVARTLADWVDRD